MADLSYLRRVASRELDQAVATLDGDTGRARGAVCAMLSAVADELDALPDSVA
jgi:hypothetical protein